MVEKLKLAVLGSPIAHSRSPQLQGSFASDCNIADFSYERIETTCEELYDTVSRLRDDGYDGFNCTMPLKTDMARLADFIGEEAKTLCSVNTVAIRDGKFHADTTDGIGILLTVRRGLSDMTVPYTEVVKGKKVVLLGAGGAARSAALSLYRGGAELTIANRTLDGAVALREMLGADCSCLPLSDTSSLCDVCRECDILINCTALGMSGKPEFETLEFIDEMRSGAIVIDAVYNPLETTLLKYAAKRGLNAVSGLWMLVYQGAAAFEKWSGILPDEDACLRAFDLIK